MNTFFIIGSFLIGIAIIIILGTLLVKWIDMNLSNLFNSDDDEPLW